MSQIQFPTFMESYNKPVVLITGCSTGGIGHALARAFAEEKCLVVATSRSLSSTADLEHDASFFRQELDVLSDDSVHNVLSNVLEKFGRIDIVVNNAGVQCVGPLAEIPLSEIENTFNTNVYVLGKLRLFVCWDPLHVALALLLSSLFLPCKILSIPMVMELGIPVNIYGYGVNECMGEQGLGHLSWPVSLSRLLRNMLSSLEDICSENGDWMSIVLFCVNGIGPLEIDTLNLSFSITFFLCVCVFALFPTARRLTGSMRLVQAVVPHMASRRKGKIVNIGSVAALAPGPWAGAYTASKAALHALTDSLRLELRPFGISVINVVPGAVKSNIGNSAISSHNRMTEWKLYKQFEEAIRARAYFSQRSKSTPSEEFAKRTVKVLLKENPPSWFSYGEYSTIMGIMYHLPIFVKDLVLRKAMKC
ncbi:NAD(P)-binding Rossmann-fold superfamily protein [Actinidia rufa]|uniref:NAD(P)-binding Rossmann-fold superfamily protein n=1 Tax=Actinidia rufa TaxID=165716 RepID=A0A7J0F6C3_9ERIC|nr:NAD(P)-binding Rossmann-fold superfamily protein [Actinidia rufa]